MIGSLISMLFDFLLNLVGTVIQIIVLPLNLAITGLLPDISSAITQVGTGLSTLFGVLPWAISLLPTTFISALLICYGIRLAVSTISISTHALVKVWNVFQKIKFW